MDKKLRKFPLQPLARRRQPASERKVFIAALERLDHRCLGEEILSQVRTIISEARRVERKSDAWKDPDSVERSLALTRALYASRRISTQEYVMFASVRVECVRDSRFTDGDYDGALEPITTRMYEVRAAYGLSEDEDWSVGEAPEEYARLSRQYNSVLDSHFGATLREFGFDDLADLHEKDREEFNRLRERGRRSVFHQNEIVPALRDIVVRYEEDARKAASAKAYSAAVTLLGAGVEGLLLLRCLRSRHKASRVALELPRRKRPRCVEDLTKWTFDNLIEVCLKAGWLPPVTTQMAVYSTAGLSHLLRVMRNHIHPGKHVRERPWIETDERDYRDVAAIYLILLSTLGHIRPVPDGGST